MSEERSLYIKASDIEMYNTSSVNFSQQLIIYELTDHRIKEIEKVIKKIKKQNKMRGRIIGILSPDEVFYLDIVRNIWNTACDKNKNTIKYDNEIINNKQAFTINTTNLYEDTINTYFFHETNIKKDLEKIMGVVKNFEENIKHDMSFY